MAEYEDTSISRRRSCHFKRHSGSFIFPNGSHLKIRRPSGPVSKNSQSLHWIMAGYLNLLRKAKFNLDLIYHNIYCIGSKVFLSQVIKFLFFGDFDGKTKTQTQNRQQKETCTLESKAQNKLMYVLKASAAALCLACIM